MLDSGGSNHRVALRAGVWNMQGGAHRRGVFGKRQNPAHKSGAHFRRLLGLAMPQLRNHIGVENKQSATRSLERSRTALHLDCSPA